MLKMLFQNYQCDKAYKHHYYEVYDEIFYPFKEKTIKFLEVGVFKGASTAAFDDYFSKGEIFGLDIFVRTKPEDLPVLQRDSVHWIKGDSMDGNIRESIKSKFGNTIEFDFILDDGAHYPLSNELTFKNLFPLLKPGGIFIIEDVWPIDIMNENEIQHPWLRRFPDKYNKLAAEKFMNTLYNSGGLVKRFDLRKNEPDSYIITIEKQN